MFCFVFFSFLFPRGCSGLLRKDPEICSMRAEEWESLLTALTPLCNSDNSGPHQNVSSAPKIHAHQAIKLVYRSYKSNEKKLSIYLNNKTIYIVVVNVYFRFKRYSLVAIWGSFRVGLDPGLIRIAKGGESS